MNADLRAESELSSRRNGTLGARIVQRWRHLLDVSHGRPVSAATDPLAPDAAHLQFKKTRFFSSLDGLRGVSILAVVWHHTHISTGQEAQKGVCLFFVISAFLIVTLLIKAKERSGGFSLPKFWGRRALRILPLYYAVLGLYAGLVYVLERNAAGRQFFENLPAFATFTANWFVRLDEGRVIFYFVWSLAAEEQFYLCWPLIERFTRGLFPMAAAAVALLVSHTIAIRYDAALAESVLLRIIASVPPGILLGVILAHALNSPTGFRWLRMICGRHGSGLAIVVLSAIVLASEQRLGRAGEISIALCMTLLVASCVIREDSDLASILRFRALAWLGTISYGVFLLHMLAVNVIRMSTTKIFGSSYAHWDFVGGSLLAIGFACISHVMFERHFLKWKDRLFRENAPTSVDSRHSAPAGDRSMAPSAVLPLSHPAPGVTGAA